MTLDVMIVEDSPTMRSVLKRTLEMCGQPAEHIHEAGDGIEALECLEQRDISIAFIDLHMPRMSGFELIERMNQDPENISVLVAVVSSDAHRRELLPLLKRGVRAIVRKPFQPEQVRDVFRSLVNLQQRGGAP